MDIMAPQEQLLIRLTLGVLIPIFIGAACGSVEDNPLNSAPLKEVNMVNVSFQERGGKLWLSDTLFTGILFSLNVLGDTLSKTPYMKGRLHGEQKKWHSDKKLKEKRFYNFGKKISTHYGWWENGNPKFEYQFKDDVYDGTVKEWYESGRPYAVFTYKNGHENGLQQGWKSDGRVKFNYEVKNGRRYGLTGTKNCTSIWSGDSI